MNRRFATATATGLALLLSGCAAVVGPPSLDEVVAQVTAHEKAFAKTMVDLDHAAFLRFVADDAVFLNGGKPLRGKAAIAAHWQPFFSGASAPFTWQPDLVEVAGSGNLAQSAGPVRAPDGKVVSRFYSTWRLEPGGQWRVVFDDGYDLCDCASK